jgi:hypothetical protein
VVTQFWNASGPFSNKSSTAYNKNPLNASGIWGILGYPGGGFFPRSVGRVGSHPVTKWFSKANVVVSATGAPWLGKDIADVCVLVDLLYDDLRQNNGVGRDNPFVIIVAKGHRSQTDKLDLAGALSQ